LDDFADEGTSENGGDGSTDAKRWNDAISGMKMEQLEDEDEMCSTAFSTTSYVCPFVEGRLRKKSVYILYHHYHLPKNCPCKRMLAEKERTNFRCRMNIIPPGYFFPSAGSKF